MSNTVGSVVSASEMLFVTNDIKPPREITSKMKIADQIGRQFSYTITSSDGSNPITYRAEPLPSGLQLDSASGVITGAPQRPGKHRILVTANNSAGHVSAKLNLTLTSDSPPVSIVAWREAHFGASARDLAVAGDNADHDRDEISNIKEFRDGTNPLDK